MRVLDLFSGIGGFSLGLERAGMHTVAFCEIDPFCRRVLAKHWPEVPCYDDVTTLTAARLAADGIICGEVADAEDNGCTGGMWSSAARERLVSTIETSGSGQACGTGQSRGRGIDLICGGFPCQDISVAGKGAGISGERSGLWREFARVIGEIRPQYAIVENVSALLHRGLGDVLGDLAALGFDAEWHCIPAAVIGAPHIRDRIWIIAVADANNERAEHQQSGAGEPRPGERDLLGGCGAHVALTGRPRLAIGQGTLREWAHAATAGSGWWAVEPDVGRVAHGVANRVDRLRSLGNSLVPQIPELIGRAIMAAE